MGIFITFEGGDGTGKSTQVRLLAARLQEQGRPLVGVREPGGTTLGEQIRPWIKGVHMAPETELLLFAAARAQLVREVINPALASGKTVIADRFADSTIAYQGHGRGLSIDLVRAVNQAATGGVRPALTLLLDLPAEAAIARANDRPLNSLSESKFEREEIAFHRRVRSGFLKLAAEEPGRILVMDASKPPEQIAEAIFRRVQALLPGKRA